jgi:hypothetical protein
MVCENPLSGNILQLNIITVYPRQCVSQKENMCKIQFVEQLKNMFSQMLIIPVTIYFDENRFKTVDIKICRLTQITGKTESDNSEESFCHLLSRKRKAIYNKDRKEKSEKSKSTNSNANTNNRKK